MGKFFSTMIDVGPEIKAEALDHLGSYTLLKNDFWDKSGLDEPPGVATRWTMGEYHQKTFEASSSGDMSAHFPDGTTICISSP
jgi:hypothetical protein